MKYCLIATALLIAAPGFAISQPRNLVLITIDTLRADYVSYNGSTRVQTPNLDALAARGVNFQRARSAVPLTLPSHTSILTALYPPSHGVRDNATFRLSEKQVTLAEVLKQEGYQTAAFVGSFVLDHRFGLNQGFDVYDDKTGDSANAMENLEAQRNAGAVHEAFARWFESSAKTPFFVWIHLYDPHLPYTPPEPFKTKYPKDPYAGEVAYADAVVGRILKDLDERKLTAGSVIAVVGDHGEGLGEHGEYTHSLFIYNSTLHVPMMIVAPEWIKPALKINGLCRIIDLAPTLLDYLGVKKPLGEGVSLRPLIEGKPEKEITAYSESLYGEFNLGWSKLLGLETKSYRYIEAPKAELYEIQKDPKETQNRIGSARETARRMSQELQARNREANPQNIDEETREKLASLGYVSSAPAKAPAQANAADPKDKIEVWNELQMIMHAFEIKDYEIAIAALEQLKRREKMNPMVHQYLGMTFMRMGDWSNADRTYREALHLGIDSPETHLNLGIIAQQQKQFAKAEKELQIAIAMDPVSVTARFRLGTVYRAMRQFDKSLEELNEALQINPGYVFALDALGNTYASMDRQQEAAGAYQKAIEADPSYAPVYSNFAILLERSNQKEKACEMYAKFLKLSASDRDELAIQRERAMNFVQQCPGVPHP